MRPCSSPAGRRAGPLAARTVGHAHRVLHRALERAVEAETLSRNVASVMSPPQVEAQEVEILNAGRDRHRAGEARRPRSLHPSWPSIWPQACAGASCWPCPGATSTWTARSLRVERSLEETKAGLRFKPPKTAHGRRTISLPPNAVAALREHRRKQLETRLALGLGRPEPDALVFCQPDGSPITPSWLSYTWRNTCVSLKLPKVTLHALRHTHASR